MDLYLFGLLPERNRRLLRRIDPPPSRIRTLIGPPLSEVERIYASLKRTIPSKHKAKLRSILKKTRLVTILPSFAWKCLVLWGTSSSLFGKCSLLKEQSSCFKNNPILLENSPIWLEDRTSYDFHSALLQGGTVGDTMTSRVAAGQDTEYLDRLHWWTRNAELFITGCSPCAISEHLKSSCREPRITVYDQKRNKKANISTESTYIQR